MFYVKEMFLRPSTYSETKIVLIRVVYLLSEVENLRLLSNVSLSEQVAKQEISS